MATAPTHIKMQKGFVTGPYTMSVADSADGYLYAPDTSNARKLVVATANTFCGWPERRLKVGDSGSLIVTGSGPAIASGAISLYQPVTNDSAGKCKAGTPGTDNIIGYNDGPATTTDGDIFTLIKIA
jgi:hypothetical protein